MNVYDQAHQLAQAITESQEYLDFDRLRTAVGADPAISEMVADFEKKQLELQARTMTGEIDQNAAVQELQGLATIVMANPTAAQYLQAQMRFALMIHDVEKIIADAAGVDVPGNV